MFNIKVFEMVTDIYQDRPNGEDFNEAMAAYGVGPDLCEEALRHIDSFYEYALHDKVWLTEFKRYEAWLLNRIDEIEAANNQQLQGDSDKSHPARVKWKINWSDLQGIYKLDTWKQIIASLVSRINP